MEFDLSKQTIKPIDIEEEMKKSFIAYAMATIVSRALPDVRDGLKPVHRRILYSMHELGITPEKPFRKSIRIVGDVLGKFHPHGDTAVYDAMVRMAQDFSTRYMMVQGHGNFGSIDGDGAAASRYTEARMSKISSEMLRDIDKDTVDMVPNFDETTMQPSVLPSRFPNLLVNGSSGIAVGMATNIPPHNLGEVVSAVIALIENPDITIEELITHISGPDFPTGAEIMGVAGILKAYRTGRGRVIMRGVTDIEEMTATRNRIVITQIPYQVNKSRMVEKIAELVQTKRMEGISDIRDESDRTGMRVVIELKRDVNANVIINQLYKHTQLQDTFGVNMLALVNGEPKRLSLKEVLYYYLEHQKDVETRRVNYDLEKAEARAHILEGLLKALDVIDAVIALIRRSKNDTEARTGLMTEFELSLKQAQAILDMRLRRLTGLESARLLDEYEGLKLKIIDLQGILADEGRLLTIIKDNLIAISAKFSDDRRTIIKPDMSDIDMEDLIPEENMVVTITKGGYIKRISTITYRAQRRGGVGITGQGTKAEDVVDKVMAVSTHDWLFFFTDRGRVHRLKCFQLPEAGRQARGMAVVNVLQLDPGERVQEIVPMGRNFDKENDERFLMFATKHGVVKRTPLMEYSNLRNVGLKAINLADDDSLISVKLVNETDEIFMTTKKGSGIRFKAEQARSMHRVSTGVRGIKLRAEDEAVDMVVVDEEKRLLIVTSGGYGKRTEFSEFRIQSRGGNGMRAHMVTDVTGDIVKACVVEKDEDVIMMSQEGIIIRTPVDAISLIGRSTRGVRVMRLRDGDRIASVAVLDQAEVEEMEVEETGQEVGE